MLQTGSVSAGDRNSRTAYHRNLFYSFMRQNHFNFHRVRVNCAELIRTREGNESVRIGSIRSKRISDIFNDTLFAYSASILSMWMSFPYNNIIHNNSTL